MLPTSQLNGPVPKYLLTESLLREVFDRFSASRITWAIARNAEGLPSYTRNDVDILIEPKRLAHAKDIVQSSAGDQGWSVIGTLSKRNYTCLLLAIHQKHPFYLPIDLFSAFEYRAHPFVECRHALQNRIQNDSGIWVLPDGFVAASTVMKELLPHSVLKENSREEVQNGAQHDSTEFNASIVPILGKTLSEDIRIACANGRWAEVNQLSGTIRRTYRSFDSMYPIRMLSFCWKNFVNLFSPNVSTFIVIVGPDGSGKSTLANILRDELLKNPFKDCRCLRSRFGVIPELKQFKNAIRFLFGKSAKKELAIEPGLFHSGMMKPLPAVQAMAYATYYAIDQLLGRAKLRIMRSRWNVVVFDRYFYDYSYQLGYKNCPKWYLTLLESLGPRPDHILYIDRKAKAIFALKPELSVEEIERQQTAIQSRYSKWPTFRRINGRDGVEAMKASAIDVVVGAIFQAQEELS